ncbi:DUF4190 domain-containing protein [Diaminobutyricibacter sp. McL0618]|uniref:DUF4190 domain-containing protein n=1 Tax=Leifsonia sp. McL0618 TaxID=3415677 RepID=UPI003CF01388
MTSPDPVYQQQISQPYTQPYAPAYASPYAPPKTNVLAIIAFVAAFVVPIAAIVLGHISVSQLRTSGEQGRGLAIAGLIIGYVFTAFTVVFFVLWLVLFFGVMATHGFSGTQA